MGSPHCGVSYFLVKFDDLLVVRVIFGRCAAEPVDVRGAAAALCRCVKVYFAAKHAAENFTFSKHTAIYSTSWAGLYSAKS